MLFRSDMFFQDAKLSGIDKQWLGFDCVVQGSPEICFRFDPRNTAAQTPWISISSDTRPGDLNPMEFCSTSVAPRLRHEADEAFQLDLLQCYWERM